MPRIRDSESGTQERPHAIGSPRGRRDAASASPHHTPVLLLIVVLASVATVLCYRAFATHYDRGLRLAVTDHLRRLFPDTRIQIGSVTSDGPGKLVVMNLQLAGRQQSVQRDVIRIQRAVVSGDLDVADWAQDTIRVRHIDLFGVAIDVWPEPDGQWSISSLHPRPNPQATPPSLAIEDGVLRLHSEAGRQAQQISFHDIQGRIAPQPDGKSAAGIAGSRMHVEFNCRSSGLVNRVLIDGTYDTASGAWESEGRMEELQFSPRLLQQLPPSLSQYLSQLSGLECRATSSFKISSEPNQRVEFEIQGAISGGRLRDARLPYQLDDLSSSFFCNNQMLQLRTMKARSGSAELELSTDIMGFRLDVPIVIHAKARHLELDRRLYESLPLSLQQQWDKLQLAGRVSGDIRLSFDGVRWTPSAAIQCEGVAMKPWLFPYPLVGLQGLVHYQHGVISSNDLRGRAGGRPIAGSFSLSHQENEWTGKLNCHTTGAVAIDEQLLSALTPVEEPTTGLESFVRSLQPTGAVELKKATFEREHPGIAEWHRTIDAHVFGGSIKYAPFPYPIYEIHGRIAGQDDRWWLQNFEGHNDSGRIHCSGNWTSGLSPIPFQLDFEALALPIEEELKLALPQDAQFIWDELQPSGSIDRVVAHISRDATDSRLKTEITIEEDSHTNIETGRSLSIYPRTFPLLWTDIDCHIQYQPGRVVIDSASGINADSRVSIRGECRPQRDGRWLADVRWQPRTRFIVDGQLLRALPKTVRDSLVKLDFRGPVSVLGNTQIVFPNQAVQTVSTSWDCQFDVENGQLGDGGHIGDLRGTVWMRGVGDGAAMTGAGEVSMDALTVKGIPVTRLRGPFAVEEHTLYFGSRVQDASLPLPPEQSQTMTADALAGQLTVAGLGKLDTGKFYFTADLQNAELSTLLQDVGVQQTLAEASCNATISFNGIPWNSQTWNGQGEVHLRDAKLFQLPFMIRLMRVASINASDDSAFQRADIQFEIDGDRIPLNIACDGEVLRVRGDGWVNLRREVDLELYSYVGRRIPISQVVTPLLEESRFATFMMIEVDGTLDNPVMQRRPFPQLEATWQQIFPEVANRPRESLIPWR